MIKHLATEQDVASTAEPLRMAVDLGAKLVPCQMTMDLLGLQHEDMIDRLRGPAAATTMPMQARDAMTLFI